MSEGARIAEAIEIAAYRDMYAAMPAGVAAAIEAGVHTVADATVLTARRIPVGLFNRAVGLGDEQSITESDVDAVLAVLRAHAGPRWFFQHGAASKCHEVPRWLAARGLFVVSRWAKMLRDTNEPPVVATDFTIRGLGPKDGDAFAATISASHGTPPLLGPWLEALLARPRWQAFGAFDGERMIAAATMFVEGPHGWLGMAGTLVSHRRRGAQGALLARRIVEARALGCTAVATETGKPEPDALPNPSLDNMLRTGFREVDARANYAPSP